MYLGDFELFIYQKYSFESVSNIESKALVTNYCYFAFAVDFNKPPSNLNLNMPAINLQHSNYGYPFSAN